MLSAAGIPVQTPPNLSRPDELKRLLALGIADWGGISPVTKDYVNPEKPWPDVEELRAATQAAGLALAARLPVYPKYCTSDRSAPDVLRRSSLRQHGPALRHRLPGPYPSPWRGALLRRALVLAAAWARTRQRARLSSD
jgi:hypothetical protein